jgi:hypothetical protein
MRTEVLGGFARLRVNDLQMLLERAGPGGIRPNCLPIVFRREDVARLWPISGSSIFNSMGASPRKDAFISITPDGVDLRGS